MKKPILQFDYDTKLTNIEGREICPSIVKLRNKKTGEIFVPSKISGISEDGTITEYTLVHSIIRDFIPEYFTTTVPATDLKYFGLQPLDLPESVIVNGKREIQIKKDNTNEQPTI